MSGVSLLRTAMAVRRHARSSRAELVAWQDAQLRRLVAHAYERVPYYRRLFDRHRLHPRHIRGVVDLDLIPVTSKQDLRSRASSEVLSRGLDPDRLLTVRTSGSSGEPLVIRRTWLEQSVHYLFRLRTNRLLGIGPRDRIATVGLIRPRDPRDRKLIGRAMRRAGFLPTLRIDGLQAPEAIAEQLAGFDPAVIIAMPGMLTRVADYLLETGRWSARPRLLVVGGEVLTPLMQRRLAEAFGAAPTQTYASHEFPLLGWQCPASGEVHTCDDAVLVEVLRDGRPAAAGERGEVVATNLNAYAMPFIRYRLADVARRGNSRCVCGTPFGSIQAIEGRMLDQFPLPDGRILHPYHILRSCLAGDDQWMRQYQLLQERRDRIELRVVPRASNPSEIDRIERSVRALLGSAVHFQVRLVDEIPLEPTGKFRPSRSLVDPEPVIHV